jgi:(E)-4-hydroxy-3-methylbut-2-enyl-diphosphate synthase
VLNARVLEDLGFFDFKISVKSSDVLASIAAYRALSDELSYPLHIGITEAGPVFPGTIKSAIGIGALLADGIGDTIRVSLSGDPVEEVRVGRQILKSLGLLADCVNIVSCPTCARALIDVVGIANEIERLTSHIEAGVKISILGCVVNGPGEALEADIGVFGFSTNIAKVYLRGNEVAKCKAEEIVPLILELLDSIVQTNGSSNASKARHGF